MLISNILNFNVVKLRQCVVSHTDYKITTNTKNSYLFNLWGRNDFNPQGQTSFLPVGLFILPRTITSTGIFEPGQEKKVYTNTPPPH